MTAKLFRIESSILLRAKLQKNEAKEKKIIFFGGDFFGVILSGNRYAQLFSEWSFSISQTPGEHSVQWDYTINSPESIVSHISKLQVHRIQNLEIQRINHTKVSYT